MRIQVIILALLTAASTLNSCGTSPDGTVAASSGLSVRASWPEECCDCLQASIKMSDRMKQLMESGRREEVIHLSEEAGRIANEGINCCINRWKLSHTGELSSEAFSSLLGEACPEMPTLMKEELLQLMDSKR